MRAKIKAQDVAAVLTLDRESHIPLQAQLRGRLVKALATGALPPGAKLPSTRSLSSQLHLSRNTVSIVYNTLVAEGHLEARERSGIYVPRSRPVPTLVQGGGQAMPEAIGVASVEPVVTFVQRDGFRCPPDWQKYPFPFIEGRFDRSLFPMHEWREARRVALTVSEGNAWSVDAVDADDEMLIEEIRTKLLPRRGILAEPDELLVTVSTQQALFLAIQLFVSRGSLMGVEDPGAPEVRQMIEHLDAKPMPIPADHQGLIPEGDFGRYAAVHVTPSRQRPTGVTLSRERRMALLAAAKANDFMIIEDDSESEMTYGSEQISSLKSLDHTGHVVFVSSLLKVLAPGVRLAVMVGPRAVISAARRLRDLMTGPAAPNNQRTLAYFLTLGHYDKVLRNFGSVYERRLIALREALNHYRPLSLMISPTDGGTSYWVKSAQSFDTDRLVQRARSRGVLIEPAQSYFTNPEAGDGVFRMGVTSLRHDRIREGVARLSEVMRSLKEETLGDKSGQRLSGADITSLFEDETLLYHTVYGDPCTIRLHGDGRLTGRAGYANEERDEGHWWVEDDRWYRKWSQWAYGETAGFSVLLDGDQVIWLNEQGEFVDSAVLASSLDEG